jgi:hypothetical protein
VVCQDGHGCLIQSADLQEVIVMQRMSASGCFTVRALVFFWCLLLAHAQTPTVAAPTAPAQSLALFDFWVGDWTARWTLPDGTQGRGRNHIAKILEGSVIEESFEEAQGSKQPRLLGRSLTVLEKSSGTWRQSWADNQGGFFAFRATTEGSRRILMTDWKTESAQRRSQRMVFYNIAADTFDWDWESTTDGGVNWKLQWRIHYTRVTP